MAKSNPKNLRVSYLTRIYHLSFILEFYKFPLKAQKKNKKHTINKIQRQIFQKNPEIIIIAAEVLRTSFCDKNSHATGHMYSTEQMFYKLVQKLTIKQLQWSFFSSKVEGLRQQHCLKELHHSLFAINFTDAAKLLFKEFLQLNTFRAKQLSLIILQAGYKHLPTVKSFLCEVKVARILIRLVVTRA